LLNLLQGPGYWQSTAGATGSYGTVTEPCNFPGKFPNPAIVMQSYLGGSTLIEAYWKSVSMPGQGIFIGEPLAAPFKGCRIKRNQAGLFVFDNKGLSGNLLRSDANCGLLPRSSEPGASESPLQLHEK
jgi:hypothetical protein